MPEWMASLTVGEIVATIVGVLAVVGVVVKLYPTARALSHLIRDLHGTPDRVDRAGNVIKPGEPSIRAQLQAIRAQVENSHKTNLRDDIDKLAGKLDEHIEVAKHHDRYQEETSQRLEDHIQQTEELMPMMTELHERWAEHRRKKD